MVGRVQSKMHGKQTCLPSCTPKDLDCMQHSGDWAARTRMETLEKSDRRWH
uniref:Uncharacterized protein n=1 Tax=Piliocolobus tephrosceles TaxID=591936 RepID=A0A8C9J6U9_9PRIM